jgi:hypothetical protein
MLCARSKVSHVDPSDRSSPEVSQLSLSEARVRCELPMQYTEEMLMARESGPLRNQGKAITFWWIAIPAFMLAVFNEAALLTIFVVRPYAVYLKDAFGLTFGFLESEGDTAVYLQYLSLVALILFFFGLAHGRRNEKVRVTLLLSLIVSFAGGTLAFVILPLILFLVINGEIGLSLLGAWAISPVLLGFLLVMGAGVGGLGGLIGNRLLRRNPRPEEVTHP